jgi:hypothetical protein
MVVRRGTRGGYKRLALGDRARDGLGHAAVDLLVQHLGEDAVGSPTALAMARAAARFIAGVTRAARAASAPLNTPG